MIETTQTTPFRTLIAVKRTLGEERTGGLILVAVTVLVLAWANSPLVEYYLMLKETHFHIGLGNWLLDMSLHHWLNDGMMVVFFLLIGLEIKREFTKGALADSSKAMLTIAAAIGGMIAPAFIFLLPISMQTMKLYAVGLSRLLPTSRS